VQRLDSVTSPIGQDLRLTIVSTDDAGAANGSAAESAKPDQVATAVQETANAAQEKPLDSIRAMYAALRDCWVPRVLPVLVGM